MTQEEETRYMQSLTNEELVACLRWYGHDPYYNEDYEYTIKEIERRLNGGKMYNAEIDGRVGIRNEEN